MNRRQVENFVDSLHYNNNSKKDNELDVNRTLLIFGLILPALGLKEGRCIISCLFFLSTIVVDCIYVYAWKSEQHILRSASGLLTMYLGTISFAAGIILGREWIPSNYKLPIIVVHLITAFAISLLTIIHTRKAIKKDAYAYGKYKQSIVINASIKITGFGSVAYALTRGGIKTNAILIVICMYMLMFLMLGLIVKLIMGHHYIKHISEPIMTYRVHKRSPIHRK